MQAIEQIDRKIDANRRALMARLHCNPECSARAWQNAWDRCPDFQKRDKELYLQRGLAQQERDAEVNAVWKKMQRRAKRGYGR